MKLSQIVKDLLKENQTKRSLYFLRWTSDPHSDKRRNFSGHMQAWFETREEAMEDYRERVESGVHMPYPPRKDITTGMWNSEPEWGLSGYSFYDEKTFKKAMSEIEDISWHHKDNNNQELYVFKADKYILGDGFDGEDVFKDIDKYWGIDQDMSYDEVMALEYEKNW